MNYLRKDALVQWVFCPEIGGRTVDHAGRRQAETQSRQCFTRIQAVRLWLDSVRYWWTAKVHGPGNSGGWVRSRSLGIAPMRLGFADASPEFLIICVEERSVANHGQDGVPVLMTPL
jgi:hypothetical protein